MRTVQKQLNKKTPECKEVYRKKLEKKAPGKQCERCVVRDEKDHWLQGERGSD